MQIKIADFAYTIRMCDKDGNYKLIKEYVGTRCYCAPEITEEGDQYGDEVDIYALGATLLIMVLGQENLEYKQMRKTLWYKRKKFWKLFTKKLSSDFRNLIEQMLAYDAEDRCSL